MLQKCALLHFANHCSEWYVDFGVTLTLQIVSTIVNTAVWSAKTYWKPLKPRNYMYIHISLNGKSIHMNTNSKELDMDILVNFETINTMIVMTKVFRLKTVHLCIWIARCGGLMVIISPIPYFLILQSSDDYFPTGSSGYWYDFKNANYNLSLLIGIFITSNDNALRRMSRKLLRISLHWVRKWLGAVS